MAGLEIDIELWLQSKLVGDWSAPAITSQITKERLQKALPVFPKGTQLDNMVKVRLLLACLLLGKSSKADCAEELEQLANFARSDDDEWVRIMGAAVGDFSGQLDLEAVMSQSALVSQEIELLSAAAPALV